MESSGGRVAILRDETKKSAIPNETSAQEERAGGKEKKAVRVVSIGELGGGTTYFGRDNCIGFYSWMKDKVSQGAAPDHIIIHGEAFPEISQFATKGGKSKSLVLTDFINGFDESVVFIRPYLSRITDLIKRNHLETGVTYVMGPSDFANLNKEYELILSMFNYNQKQIVESRDSYKAKVEDTEAIIDNYSTMRTKKRQEQKLLEEKLEAAKKRHAGDKAVGALEKGIENYRRGIGAMDEKISQQTEELGDYRRVFDLYTDLLKLWLNTKEMEIKKVIQMFGDNIDTELLDLVMETRGKQSIEEIHSEVKEALERTQESMSKVDKDLDKAKFKELEERSKALSSILKKYSHNYIGKVKEEAEKEKQKNMGPVQRFTHNLPGTPDLAKLADEIAHETITASIKDAFGRSISVQIVSDNYADIDVKGLKVRVTNKPSNGSQSFTSNNAAGAKLMLRGGAEDYDVLISARSPYAAAEPVPRFNKSKDYVYTLTSAPFVDVGRLAEAWNGKIKTTFTEMFAKSSPSSGFDELEYDGYSFRHTFHTSQGMAMYADKEKRAQARMLAKEIRGISPSSSGLEEPVDAKELLQLQNKLPSELRVTKSAIPRLLTWLGVDVADAQQRRELADRVQRMDFEGGSRELSTALKWLAGYILPSQADVRKPEKLDFMLLTDVHIGSPGMGVPQYVVLDAMTRYLADTGKSQYVLAMLGDNLEGIHKHIQNELHNENDPLNIRAYKEFLARKGIQQSDPRFEQEMNAYLAWQHMKDSIPHLDSQPQVFTELAKGIIERAQAVFIVSGNHWNKSFPERNQTEANTLAPLVKSVLPKGRQDKVFKFDGGDSGFGVAEITNGAPDIRVAHKGDANMIYNKLRAQEWVTLLGDKHVHKAVVVDNKVSIIGLPIQGMTLYPESIGMPVTNDALRGMSGLTVTFAGKDMPLAYTDYFISVKELKERGYIRENALITEFEATRTSMQLKTQKVKV